METEEWNRHWVSCWQRLTCQLTGTGALSSDSKLCHGFPALLETAVATWLEHGRQDSAGGNARTSTTKPSNAPLCRCGLQLSGSPCFPAEWRRLWSPFWHRKACSEEAGPLKVGYYTAFKKRIKLSYVFIQFSLSVVSDSLWPREPQHPCPSPPPGVHSDSRPSSQWCHPAISSSVVPFSSCLMCIHLQMGLSYIFKLERKLSIRMYSLISLKIYMYVCQGQGGINLSVYKRFKVCVYVHTYYNITNKKTLEKMQNKLANVGSL